MPGKNYSANRYSTLNQITTANVKQLKEVWSFSTGALRGHEGAAARRRQHDVRHSSFSDSESARSHIYALDLDQGGRRRSSGPTPRSQDERAVPVACCDVVHRGLNYAAGQDPV